MSNWVTLPNGVHLDLDDPNNPITGDGSYESYFRGGDKGGKGSGSGSKGGGSGKGGSKVKFTADPTMSGKDSDSFDRDLERAFKEFDGDEDAILDALRSTGKDYGMSNGDLQAVVESYVMRNGGTSSFDKLLRSMGRKK